MRNLLTCTAIGVTLCVAGAALAQTPPASKPTAPTTGAPATSQPSGTPPSAAPTNATPTTSSTTAPAPPAASTSGSNAAANAGAGASLMTGMSVKDNTGAVIGEIKQLKGGLATIQMGTDSFTVDANKLGVSAGAATINSTEAELKQMLASATKK